MAVATSTAIIAAGVAVGAGAAYAGAQQGKASKAAIRAQESAEERARREAEEARERARLEKEKAYKEARGIVETEAGKTIPTLSELPTAQKLRQTLEERLAGRGVGFRPEVLEATTAPYATARREGFKKYEVPAISAAASARGLGRSTIPVSQIRLSSQEAERDIEQRVSDVTMMNEQQIRQEINTALEQYKQFTGAELASQQEKAQYERTGQYALAEIITKQGSDLAEIELATGNTLANISFQGGTALASLLQNQGTQATANTLKMAEIVGSASLGYAQATSAANALATTNKTNELLQQIIDEKSLTGGGVSTGASVPIYRG